MNIENIERKIQKKLDREYEGKLRVKIEDECIKVKGTLESWEDVVHACSLCVVKKSHMHVVNDIEFTGANIPKMRVPKIKSSELEGEVPDVLIIGGGISGASIARELTRWKLKVLLVEKE